MFTIVRSNRTEKLFEDFLDRFIGLRNPLVPEVVIVQDKGMARWLAHCVADSIGIAANIEFVVPGEIADRVYRAWFGLDIPAEGWTRDFLVWAVLRHLPALVEDKNFGRLRDYLGAERDWLKLYRLARKVASVFHKYLIYRPEMLLKWEEGRVDKNTAESEDLYWQAELWKRIVQCCDVPHQARLYGWFCEALKNNRPPTNPEILPHRVFAFGITALAPVHIDVLEGLSRHVDIVFYHLNPCREYWGDVRRSDSYQSTSIDDFYRFEPNPIMASWAQAGRFLLDRLLDLEVEFEEIDLFEDPGKNSLLRALQSDVLNLKLHRDNQPPAESNESVQVHVCHSRMREIQILHDRIADMLEKNREWKPEDFVVMAPDINVYAPYVEAVFGSRKDPEIPWNISERLPLMEDPLLEALVSLLKLPRWRCTASDIMSLLEKPSIARRFGIDESSPDRLRRWIRESGIRWGIDKEMREEIGLPGENANTWRMGLDRLITGYALPPTEMFFSDVLSYPHVEGSEALLLGGLFEIIDKIKRWRERLRQKHNPEKWQNLINELLEDFCEPDSESEESLERFRHAMDSFVSAARASGFTEEIPVSVVEAAVRDHLGESPAIKRFLTGGVTFCNLTPMRTIPFRVVWILGMNDQDFPRPDRSPGFDLVNTSPRKGDRFRQWEDRFLFLEAFLSARDIFAVSYVGRDIRDNSERVPSILVSELLDTIDRKWRSSGNIPVSRKCIIEHPLQPFSQRIYDGSDSRIFSYDSIWCVDITQGFHQQPFINDKFELKDEPAENNIVNVESLVRFYRNPTRWFLERCLGLAIPSADDLLEDSEPLVLDSLNRYRVVNELVHEMVQQREFICNVDKISPIMLKKFTAKGLLPHGAAGRVEFKKACNEAIKIVEMMISLYRDTSFETLKVDKNLGWVVLEGIIPNVTSRGCILYRPGSVRGRDLIELWIYHLVLCSIRKSQEELESAYVYVKKDKGKRNIECMILKDVENAEEHLKDLIEIWFEGHKRPIHFFPNSGWKYLREISSGRGKNKKPEEICGNEWKNEYEEIGEYFDPAVRIAFRGQEPLNEEFCDLSKRIFGPLLESLEG